jgi:signal peptidase I
MEALLEHPVPLRERLRAVKWRRLRRLAGWGLLVSVVAAWAVFVRPTFLGGPTTLLIVSGHSMEPRLHSGDLVVTLRQRTYRRGDVIAYHIPKRNAGAGALVIHRIVGGSAKDGYITRGDNRNYRDPWRPKRSDIAGEMKLRAPRLGLIPVFAHSAIGMALIAAFVGFLVLRGGTETRADADSVGDVVEEPDSFGAVEPETRAAVEPLLMHLLFVVTPSGYELLERDGEAPTVGTTFEEGSRRYRVSKLGRSPLPADTRACAYLEPV